MKSYHKLKNRIAILAPALFAVATLTACGGGSSGGSASASSPQSVPMSAGTFLRTMTNAPVGPNIYPFTAANEQMRFQQLHLAAEIGASGYIDSIGFRRHTAKPTDVTCADVTIKVGHTDLSELNSNAKANVHTGEGSLVSVAGNSTITIPAGEAGEFFDIQLTTPFYYNGKDNLVVEIERMAACSGSVALSRIDKANRSFYATPIEPSGDGTLSAALNLARFGFSGGDLLIAPGAAGISSAAPFSNTLEKRRSQSLFMADEINGSGAIAGIAVITNIDTTAEETYTVDVTLGHTTLAELGATLADNINVGGSIKVASGLDFVVPAGMPAGSMIWLPLTKTFEYNGTDNLVVDLRVTNNPLIELSWRTSQAGAKRKVSTTVDGTEGVVGSSTPHLGIRFHGGKVGVFNAPSTDVVTNGDQNVTGVTFPLAHPDVKAQFLYLAAEMGGAGYITKLACRIGDVDYQALSIVDYTVVMDHTSERTLQSTFADNHVNPKTVFSGNVVVPFIRKGDWHEIVLTTPYFYNGKDNLLVEISGTSSEPYSGCVWNNSLFELSAGRQVMAYSSTDVSGIATNYLTDMLFDIAR